MREVPRPAAGVPDETLSGVARRLREGGETRDEAALRTHVAAAFTRHEARLRALVAVELRGFSSQQVEDTVQDVMVVAWRKLPEHQGRSFRAWLFGIATHTCANLRRKRRELLSGDDLLEPASDAASAYRRLRREERDHLVREAAARVLDTRDQELVHMRLVLDLPRDEIAHLLGFDDADAVRARLQRATRALGRELEARLRELGHTRSLLDESGDG